MNLGTLLTSPYKSRTPWSVKKVLVTFAIILGFLSSSSLYARELNSSNIANPAFGNCPIGAPTCFIERKGITSIASGTFVGYNNLQNLYLRSNQITEIDAGDLNGLSNLNQLLLGNNQITSIESSSFIGLSNLQNLDMEYNQLTQLSSGMFTGLSNLQQISLYNNQITQLSSGNFAGLVGLQSLNLGNNQITSLADGAFHGLNNLQSLELWNNQITSIASGTFTGLNNNLQSLELWNNEITSIASGAFNYLYNLQNLSLHYNQITSIVSGTFDNLSSLQSLTLNSNQISEVSSGMFTDLSSLQSLSLNNNQISELSSGVFAGISSLQSLNLNDNQISELSSGMFAGISSLQSLSIDSNKLTAVQPSIFTELTNLQSLSLNRNCLDSENKSAPIYSQVYSFTIASADTVGFDIAGIVSDFSATPYTLYTNDQRVCVGVTYSPATSTSGSVTGSLIFYGPISKIDILQAANPTMSIYDHIFTENGTGLLDYTSLVDTNYYLWDSINSTPKTVLANVTWIDNTAPGTPTIIAPLSGTSMPADIASGVFVTFSGTAETGSLVTVSISGQTYTGITDSNGNFNIPTVLMLPVGSYTARVTATDTVGNISPESTVIIVFTAIVIPTTPTNNGGGGGGGAASLHKDECPQGDFTASYYDNDCGTPSTTTGQIKTGTISSSLATQTITYTAKEIYNNTIANNYCYTRSLNLTVKRKITTIFTPDEFNKALTFLYAYGVTSYNNIDQFQPNALLSREQAAKMFSNFAMNVLCRIPNTALDKDYSDIESANSNLQPYITLAYQLGLMQGDPDGKFRPKDSITKAEVNAILVRLLLESYLLEDIENIRYKEYSKVSTKLSILDTEQEADNNNITRQETFIMLFRAYKNQVFILNGPSYSLQNRESFIPKYSISTEQFGNVMTNFR